MLGCSQQCDIFFVSDRERRSLFQSFVATSLRLDGLGNMETGFVEETVFSPALTRFMLVYSGFIVYDGLCCLMYIGFLLGVAGVISFICQFRTISTT